MPNPFLQWLKNLLRAPKSITPEQALELHKQGAVLLDVRTPAEHKQEHIAKSLSVPLSDLNGQLSKLPEKPLIVYCQSGMRSAQAARLLMREGKQVYNLTGGILQWKQARQPTRKG